MEVSDRSLLRSNVGSMVGSVTEDSSVDEIKELQSFSRADTRRIGRLRVAVFLSLLVTGATVALTTLHLLKKAEKTDFEEAVRAYSEVV